ncbi:MAG: malto-oligosyltrehalose synthase, partial [Myxococcales bacterium]
ATQIVDYLDALGITDVYTSPPMAASADSPHGYDLLDHGAFRSEIGGKAGFDDFAAALRARGLGLLLDWVPNHMGVGVHGNGWWDDVLEHGPASRHADHFDIDWDTARPDLRDRVMLPVLGDTYGEVLERGELRLDWHHDRFVIRYFERRLPVGPEAVALMLGRLERLLPAADADAHEELASLRWGLSRLPSRHDRTEDAQRERARENERLRRRLCALLSSEVGAAARQRLIDEVNGAPGFGTSFDALDEVLQAQNYRLSHWRLANEQINYRRFFDVNQLAAVRMEDPVVFEAAHRMLTGLVLAGQIKALRIDHVDGLYDPAAYLYALQGQLRGRIEGASGLTADDLARPVPVLVEKILAPEESLPTDWPVDGTTGYEFLAAVGGLWVDGRSERAFTRLYQRFTGDRRSFADHVHESKHEVLANNFVSEVTLLVRTLERIASADRRSRDFSTHALAIALRAVMAAFPVYRTYLVPDGARHEQDVASIRHAIGQARKHQPALGAILNFIERILLLQEDSRPSAEQVQFALRFQQMTGPVTAKAVEDTAFYRYPRLLCLNEVGGEPGHFGTTPEAFHSLVSDRARRWPLAMATTATHDTKRGEDASARIAVLTEMPTQWSQTVDRWSALTAAFKPVLPSGVAPSPVDEYAYYQALVGAWPFTGNFSPDDEFIGRMTDFMQKALREAKTRTSWLSPDDAYESAVRAFVAGSLRDEAFVAAVRAFCDPLSPFGASNALAQATIRLCSPGVVDTYQGTELWHQPLVDPDNRRPVDYELRRRLLADLHQRGQGDRRALARSLLADHTTGAIKLHVVHTLLQARRDHRALFLLGDYHPLPGSEHLVAFVRQHRQQRLIVCVARLPLRLTDGRAPWATGAIWGNRSLRLPAGTYRELLTGAPVGARGNLPLARLFADLPVAVLLQESDQPPPSVGPVSRVPVSFKQPG